MIYETTNVLHMAIWNCNGTLWSDPGSFAETYTGRDSFLHGDSSSLERGLSEVLGYVWEFAYRVKLVPRGWGYVAREVWRAYLSSTCIKYSQWSKGMRRLGSCNLPLLHLQGVRLYRV